MIVHNGSSTNHSSGDVRVVLFVVLRAGIELDLYKDLPGLVS